MILNKNKECDAYKCSVFWTMFIPMYRAMRTEKELMKFRLKFDSENH